MTLAVTPSGFSCGARVEGVDLSQPLTADVVAEIRSIWLEHKVVAFPDQQLTPSDLERFSQYFGGLGEDPFFGHIEGHEHVCAIQRNADERTSIFAELFHSDWSFMDIPPAATALYGITIPPIGGDTLFSNQVAAYEALPGKLREKADSKRRPQMAHESMDIQGIYDKEAVLMGVLPAA